MGGSKPPAPTDPRKVIAAQQDANTQALQQSQSANQVNQSNPTGQQSWQLMGYDQYGNPQYGMSQQYNPQEQALKNFMTGSQSIGGYQGNTLMNNLSNSGNYDQAFDPTAAVGNATSGRLGQMVDYLDPYFSKQTDQLDNQMRNQGLVPGMEAYDEEMHRVRDTQNQGIQSMLAQFQPQAFQQAYTEHAAPVDEAMKWSQFGQPAPLGFSSTPQYAQNSANATQAYGNYDQQRMAQYQAQQQQRSGLLQGIGSIGGAILGGPVGAAIGGGISGMFGPSVGSSYNPSWNTTT